MKHISKALIAACLMLLLSGTACQVNLPITSALPYQQVVPPTLAVKNPAPIPLSPETVSLETNLISLYERVNPGVVSIWVITEQGGGQGSGFVLDKEGYIITNFHVVEGVPTVEVDFPSGLKTYGQVIGKDPDSDLGLVKVNISPDILQPLPLGDSDLVKIGQTVIAIGNPFGYSGTMTTGIISGKGRTLDSLRSAPGGDYFTASDIIQTDAAINPGNSGGPLLNLQGEVIGVNRAISTTNISMQGEPLNSGVSFAVAINTVKHVIPSLIAEGKYDYPYLGVEGLSEITLAAQEELKLPQASGVYITNVTSGGPAKRAGLEKGDLIIGVDNHPINDFGDLLSYLFNYKKPYDSVVLTFLRSGKQTEATVKLDKRP
jgi:S1-C subfamily serine protease